MTNDITAQYDKLTPYPKELINEVLQAYLNRPAFTVRLNEFTKLLALSGNKELSPTKITAISLPVFEYNYAKTCHFKVIYDNEAYLVLFQHQPAVTSPIWHMANIKDDHTSQAIADLYGVFNDHMVQGVIERLYNETLNAELAHRGS